MGSAPVPVSTTPSMSQKIAGSVVRDFGRFCNFFMLLDESSLRIAGLFYVLFFLFNLLILTINFSISSESNLTNYSKCILVSLFIIFPYSGLYTKGFNY